MLITSTSPALLSTTGVLSPLCEFVANIWPAWGWGSDVWSHLCPQLWRLSCCMCCIEVRMSWTQKWQVWASPKIAKFGNFWTGIDAIFGNSQFWQLQSLPVLANLITSCQKWQIWDDFTSNFKHLPTMANSIFANCGKIYHQLPVP